MSFKVESHSDDHQPGWIERHPEDQQMVTFEMEDRTITTPLFRELPPEEEKAFRQHARENYVIGSEINPVVHPVWQDEARKMNAEVCLDPCLTADHPYASTKICPVCHRWIPTEGYNV